MEYNNYLQKHLLSKESKRRKNDGSLHKRHKTDSVKTLDSTSSHSNRSNLSYQNCNTNYYTESTFSKRKSNLPFIRKKKKRVTFNENVEVIIVKSYKKYNKEEEEISIGEYFDENYNYKPYRKKRKKVTNCECNIF